MQASDSPQRNRWKGKPSSPRWSGPARSTIALVIRLLRHGLSEGEAPWRMSLDTPSPAAPDSRVIHRSPPFPAPVVPGTRRPSSAFSLFCQSPMLRRSGGLRSRWFALIRSVGKACRSPALSNSRLASAPTATAFPSARGSIRTDFQLHVLSASATSSQPTESAQDIIGEKKNGSGVSAGPFPIFHWAGGPSPLRDLLGLLPWRDPSTPAGLQTESRTFGGVSGPPGAREASKDESAFFFQSFSLSEFIDLGKPHS